MGVSADSMTNFHHQIGHLKQKKNNMDIKQLAEDEEEEEVSDVYFFCSQNRTSLFQLER